MRLVNKDSSQYEIETGQECHELSEDRTKMILVEEDENDGEFWSMDDNGKFLGPGEKPNLNI